jgi:hypothetical protein
MKLLSKLVFWLTIRPRMNRLIKLLPEASIYPFGSRYVCDPPVMNTDVDFLVYSDDDITATLLAAGYSNNRHDQNYFGISTPEKTFSTWRRGVVNLVVMSNRQFLLENLIATYICKDRNIQQKYHRIIVYEAMRGNWDVWGQVLPEDLDPDLKMLLDNLCGPHGHTLRQMYIIQHGVEI